MAGFDYECDGQMSIEDWLLTKEQEESYPIRDCGRRCEFEFCSRLCFEKRGNVWDYSNNQWIRDEAGQIVKMTNPQCDYIPGMQTKQPIICDECIFKFAEDCPNAAEDCELKYRLIEADGWNKIKNFPNGRVGGKFPSCQEWRDVLVLVTNPGKEPEFIEIEAKDKGFRGKNKVRWDKILAWKYI